MSDMAWGMWRRVHPGGTGLDNIRYFVVNQVLNKDTQGLIAEALKAAQDPVTGVPEWPGVTWDIETPQGAAMLGKLRSDN